MSVVEKADPPPSEQAGVEDAPTSTTTSIVAADLASPNAKPAVPQVFGFFSPMSWVSFSSAVLKEAEAVGHNAVVMFYRVYRFCILCITVYRVHRLLIVVC